MRAHALRPIAGLMRSALRGGEFPALTNCSGPHGRPEPGKVEGWEGRLARLVWVCYSPPSSDPPRGVEATPEAIRDDLTVLRRAGFTGLITYGSSGVLGRELPALARSQGFEGLIMGVWEPGNREEMEAVIKASESPFVLGFCVGNEGLRSRYQLPALLHFLALTEAAGCALPRGRRRTYTRHHFSKGREFLQSWSKC